MDMIQFMKLIRCFGSGEQLNFTENRTSRNVSEHQSCVRLISLYFLRDHMAWLSGIFTACMETSGIHYLKCAVSPVSSHHSKDVPLQMQDQLEFKVLRLIKM